ncbi:MAG: carboxypeptidase-like regulatory domain-containing protein [Saprospiraceae bacterium]|nr:carboxypeptidase-like regulatory domain-containing protein [Saprospiraceae bacterium]
MKQMKRVYMVFLLMVSMVSLHAQYTQTIKGQVLDADSEIPLIGANVEVLFGDEIVGTSTDIDGYFKFEKVPVGRHIIRASYLGYNSVTIPNVVVNTGKEVDLELLLSEAVNKLSEVTITATTDKDKSVNEMATISAKTFSLEEVTRYSGGRNDASRLVSNFAGVATADDSRNDIVIRGNSPAGVLWRLEGVPIPNPNHFSTLGTTGGPVSALNTNLLKNSDFITSAFPSEYGNALSGVFDVGFRNGNRDKFEFTAQLAAFSGLEFMAEGPLNKSKTSSFLISYRNSFVALADNLGLDIGTNAIPDYRDLSFKLDFGTGKLGKFSIFGIGGTSDIAFLGAEIDDNDIFAEADADSRADSRLGVVGVKHNLLFGNNAYLRTVVSASRTENKFTQERYLDTLFMESYANTNVDDRTERLAITSFYNIKHNAKLTTRIGITFERLSLISNVRDREGNPDIDMDGLPDWQQVRDVDGELYIYQPFLHAKYKLNDKLTFNGGVHAQYLHINEDYIVEPRATLNYAINEKSSWNIGYGHHSQVQPLPILFFLSPNDEGELMPLNQELDFSKAHHFVMGYDFKPAQNWRTKIETYYQYLYDVPVDRFESTFSLLNAGADFVFPETGYLINEGSGKNYGLELTVEKFFSKGYYGLLTGSLFQSKYTPSDGVERNTAFNNQYVLNVLGGKEWKVNERLSFTTDFKVTTAGGRYYTPIDLETSQLISSEVKDESRAFSEQFDPYFRLDLKLGFRLNSKKGFSQMFALDFQNLTNRENPFTRRYNRSKNQVDTVLQSGFFPDILWRIQF